MSAPAVDGAASGDTVRRVLEERARALARPREQSDPGATLELLAFPLGDERYALDAVHVEEVLPLRGLTKVPLTPPFVLGVVNHRGRILTVVEIRRLLDVPAPELARDRWVAVISAGGLVFGVATDGVPEIVRTPTDSLAPAPSSLERRARPFVQGVTPDMALVVDGEALTRHPRLIVNEEVG